MKKSGQVARSRKKKSQANSFQSYSLQHHTQIRLNYSLLHKLVPYILALMLFPYLQLPLSWNVLPITYTCENYTHFQSPSQGLLLLNFSLMLPKQMCTLSSELQEHCHDSCVFLVHNLP